jgi:AcrR family transcriptional regulator
MANIKNNSASKDTQRRLLEAAGEVFADRGFHSATMKEITDRAGASLASINYHFSDKAELYAAVMRTLTVEAEMMLPPRSSASETAPEQFKRLVHALAEQCLRRDKPRWQHVLIGREMAQPTGAMEPYIRNVIRPINDSLAEIIAAITGRQMRDPVVGLIVASIVGQCVYHAHHTPNMAELHPQLGQSMDAEQIAEHIATFSLAGIEASKLRKRITEPEE